MNNPHHLKHLARAFDSDAKARGLLEDIGYPMENAPPWTDPQSWWRAVIREIELGRIENGLFQLYNGASRQYPGNTVLAEAAAAYAPAPDFGPAPAPDPGSVFEAVREAPPYGGTDGPPAGPAERSLWPTLTLTGGERHDDFVRAVRRLDPGARLCYDTQGQVCVSVGRGGAEGEEIGRRITAEMTRRGDPEVRIDFREYRFQPYALREIVVHGPDGDGFRLNGVPSTVLARDIAAAVLRRYDDEAAGGRRGRLVRIAIDLIQPDGTARRIGDPCQALHEAGVPDGARLQLVPEVTAGARRRSTRGPGRGEGRRTPHPPPGDQRMGRLER
ncbi:hypothetical protein GCM10017673_44580 [Streptosporangium violaceochromogenes]|nr:hypothetical protein GCM10017673_44580 [Streptosporangium violaceochromogenes]